MNYSTVRSTRKQFLSITTLFPEEFDFLLNYFSKEWYRYYRTHTLEGKRRKKVNWSPQKDTPTLPTVAEKQFFILSYYKQHALQEFQAATFNLSQSKVSLWVKILTPLMEEALKKMGCLPCRDGNVLSDFVADFDTSEGISQDVVEQTRPRPVSDDAQAATYSGKKKPILLKIK